MKFSLSSLLILITFLLHGQNFTDFCSFNGFSNVYAVSADSLGNTWILEGDSTYLFRIDSLKNVTDFSNFINGVTNSKLTSIAAIDGVIFIGTQNDFVYRFNPDSLIVRKYGPTNGLTDSTINSISIAQRGNSNRIYIATPFNVFRTFGFSSTFPPFFTANHGIIMSDKNNFRLTQNKEMDGCINVNGSFESLSDNYSYLISFGSSQTITGTMYDNKPISATLNIQASVNFCSNNQSFIADSYGVYVARGFGLWDTLIHNIDVVDMVLRNGLAYVATRDSGIYTTSHLLGTSQKVLELPSDLKVNDIDLTFDNGVALATNKGLVLISDTVFCDNYSVEILTLQDTIDLAIQDTIQLYAQGCISNHFWSLGSWNSNLQSPVYTFSDTGTYTFMLNGDNNICFGDTTKNIYVQNSPNILNCDSFQLNILPISDSVDISSIDSTLIITALNNIDSVIVSQGTTTYTLTDSIANITVSTTGDYDIELIAFSSNCSDTLSLSIYVYDVNTNTNSLINRDQNKSKLYPNPIENRIVIENDISLGLIQIFDLRGVMVFSKQVEMNRIEIDLSAVPAGVYIVSVQNQFFKITK